MMFFKYLILVLTVLTFSCSEKKSSGLTIATAANMQFVMDELVQDFSQNTGTNPQVVVSSSGKLTAQIKEGAPYDVFVSADMKYPTELYEKGLTKGKPEVYAVGSLVLWTFENNTPSIKKLTNSSVSAIAIANPKLAPYGEASMEVFKHYGVLEEVKDKLVFGESMSQTNHFIISKAADAGLTVKSVVLSPQMEGKGQWIEVDTSAYSPIFQGMVVLKTEDEEKAQLAEKFKEYMISEEAKEVLRSFGYGVP